MKKIALIAALPLALSVAACGDPVDETATDVDTTAETGMEADTADTTGMDGTDATMTDEQKAEVLDESAEADEEAADRIEDTDEAAADALEASAKAKQEARDEID